MKNEILNKVLPSPAEGVDEAAEKAIEEAATSYAFSSEADAITMLAIRAFKAGALWQSRQGGGGKTLQECKDEVARKYGELEWEEIERGSIYTLNDGSPLMGYEDLYDEAAELYANQKPQTQEGWVSVKDRLPDHSRAVAVYCGKGGANYKAIGAYNIVIKDWIGYTIMGHDCNDWITHWQELPPPPTNEQKQ